VKKLIFAAVRCSSDKCHRVSEYSINHCHVILECLIKTFGSDKTRTQAHAPEETLS